MSVSLDRLPVLAASQTPVEGVSNAGPSHPNPYYGTSGSESTIASYDNSCNVPMFSLFANLINSFLRSDETPFDTRINTGKKVLSDLFERDFFYQAHVFHSAVVVVMEYNKKTLMFFGKMRETYESKATEQLRQLLSQEGNKNCDDGELKIKTMLIQKNGDSGYEMSRYIVSIQFRKEKSPEVSWKESRHFETVNLNKQLTVVIPSDEERKKVYDFVNKL